MLCLTELSNFLRLAALFQEKHRYGIRIQTAVQERACEMEPISRKGVRSVRSIATQIYCNHPLQKLRKLGITFS